MDYIEIVKKWSEEFQRRKHVLTPEEIKTLTDEEYLEIASNADADAIASDWRAVGDSLRMYLPE